MRKRVRLFRLSRVLAARAGFASLHSALWLRLLDDRDLDDITIDSYSSRTKSGFESEKHNLDGLWPWEEACFGAFLKPASSVLVAGAGGGREMIALANMGHRVVGFDASADLVEAGRVHLQRAGVSGTICDAPAGQVPSGIGDGYDALVIGRGVYHHMPRRARRVAFLAACRELVTQGAPLLMGDFLLRDAPSSAPQRRGKVEDGDSVGSAFFHRFTEQEIAAELGRAGFELVDFRLTPSPGGGRLGHAIGRAR